MKHASLAPCQVTASPQNICIHAPYIVNGTNVQFTGQMLTHEYDPEMLLHNCQGSHVELSEHSSISTHAYYAYNYANIMLTMMKTLKVFSSLLA